MQAESRAPTPHQVSPGAVAAGSCASRLRLLSDPTRLRVLRLLAHRPRRVSELRHLTGAESTLLSHHLRVLRDANLVEAERVGKTVIYRLSPTQTTAVAGNAIDLGCCQILFS